jgi:hypothetical protein
MQLQLPSCTVTVQEQGAYGYRYGCSITSSLFDTKQRRFRAMRGLCWW